MLATKYELTFEEYSYGFRPEKNIHKAVSQALKYINNGYVYGTDPYYFPQAGINFMLGMSVTFR